MKFTYTAEKAGGEVYKGIAEAKDRFALYQIVRQEGGRLLSLEEPHLGNIWSFQYWNAKLSHISEYEKILFARNLGAMLTAGLALSRALSAIDRQTKNPRMSSVISTISSNIRRGDSFHSSLAGFSKVFPPLFVAMVHAGEEGGNLPGALGLVADQLERAYLIKKKIRGALIYPSIILLAILGIGALMMIEVVPTLGKTFTDAKVDLPTSTTIIIDVSNFLVHYTAIALGLAVIGMFTVYMAFQTQQGKRITDFLLLRLPVIGGIVREVNAARASRTMASLLAAGVDVITALGIVADVVQNTYFREVIKAAAMGVGRGEALSAAFIRREDLFPSFVGEMMAVGEETGQMGDMLLRLAVFYEDEVDRSTKDMSTIIEPILMLLVGGAVGFFAFAMITPIYQISQNI